MDVLVKVSVPNHIYRFYEKASAHIAGYHAEQLMADALTAYAAVVSEDVSREERKRRSEQKTEQE